MKMWHHSMAAVVALLFANILQGTDANHELFTFGIDKSLLFGMELTESSNALFQSAAKRISEKLSYLLASENLAVDVIYYIDAKNFQFEKGTIFYARIQTADIIRYEQLQNARQGLFTKEFALIAFNDGPIKLLLDDIQDSSLQAGTCQNDGFLLSNGSCNCPPYIGAHLCTDWHCLNGGYRNNTDSICVCPAGFLGTHCEAVQCKPLASSNFDVSQTTLTYLFTANQVFLNQSIQQIHDATALMLDKVHFYNYQVSGIDTLFPMSQATFSKQLFLSFLTADNWIPVDCAKPKRILNAIYSLLTSGSGMEKSPIYVFANVHASDYSDTDLENRIVRTAIAFQVKIHVIATALEGCDGNSSSLWQTSPEYAVLVRLAHRTFGQFVGMDFSATGNSTSEIVTAMLTSQQQMPDTLTSGFYSDCRISFSNNAIFFVDSTSYFIAVTTSVPANDLRFLIDPPPTQVAHTGNWQLYRVTVYPGQIGQISLIFGTSATKTSCEFQIWASTQNAVFLSYATSELSDASSPFPAYGTPNLIVAHVTSVDRVAPINVVVRMNNSIVFQAAGSVRNSSCQFEFDFGSWSCDISDGGSVLIEGVDKQNQGFSRVYPLICDQTPPPPTTTPSTTMAPSVNCSNHGTPQGDKCSCAPSFTGSHCQCPVCRNNGTCIIVNETLGYCNCKPGYTGKNCLQFECTQNITSPYGAVTNVSLGIVILNSASMLANASLDIIYGMNYFFNYLAINHHDYYYSNFVVTQFNADAPSTTVIDDWRSVGDALKLSGPPDTNYDSQQTLLALYNTINDSAFLPGSQVLVFTNTPVGNVSKMDALQKLIALKRPKFMFLLLTDTGICEQLFYANINNPYMKDFNRLAELSGGFATRTLNVRQKGIRPILKALATVAFQPQLISQMDAEDCRPLVKETMILTRGGNASFTVYVLAIASMPEIIIQDILINQNTTYVTPNFTDNASFNLFQLTIPSGYYSFYFSSLDAAEKPCQLRILESSDYQIDYGFTEAPNDDLTSSYPIFGEAMYTVAHQVNGLGQSSLSDSGSVTLSVYTTSVFEMVGATNYVFTTTSTERGGCGYDIYFRYPWVCSTPGMFYYMKFIYNLNGNFSMRSAVTQCRKESNRAQCLNGGTLQNDSCLCVTGLWEGQFCETPVCYNGGSAVADNSAYCVCPPAFSGIHCENGFCPIVNQNAGMFDTEYRSLIFVVQKTNSMQGHFDGISSQIRAYKAMNKIRQYALVMFSDSDVTPIISTPSLGRFQNVVMSTLIITPGPQDPVSSVKSIDALTTALQLQTTNKGFIVLITDTAPDPTNSSDFFQQLQLSRSVVQVLVTNVTLASASPLLRQIAVSSGGQLFASSDATKTANFTAAISPLLNAQLGVIRGDSVAQCPSSNIVTCSVDSQSTMVYVLAYGQTIQSVKNADGSEVTGTGTILVFDGQNIVIASYDTASSFGNWSITFMSSGNNPCSSQVLANSLLQVPFGFSTNGKSDFPLSSPSSAATSTLLFHLNPISFPLSLFLQSPTVTAYLVQDGIIGTAISTIQSTTRIDCSFELMAPLNCSDGGIQLLITGIASSGENFQRTINAFCQQPRTCLNGGSLINGTCQCTSWWTGFDCRNPVCINGGTMDRYACNCHLQNYGDHCELANQLPTTTATSSTVTTPATTQQTTESSTVETSTATSVMTSTSISSAVTSSTVTTPAITQQTTESSTVETSTPTSVMTSTSTSSVALTTTSVAPTCGSACDTTKLRYDIYLLIDVSMGITDADFSSLKDILRTFVACYTVSNSMTQFAITAIANDGLYYDSEFHGGQDIQRITEELGLIQQLSENGQDLFGGLAMFGFLNILRSKNSTQMVAYFTGNTNFTNSEPYTSAQHLAATEEMNFVAIQYGANANLNSLSYLVGGDNCVYLALTDEARSGLVPWLNNKTCNQNFCNITLTTVSPEPSTTSISTTVSSATQNPSLSCDLKQLKYDVLLVIDISSHIQQSDFPLLKIMLTELVSEYNISNYATKFAIFLVSNSVMYLNSGFMDGEQTLQELLFVINNGILQDNVAEHNLESALDFIATIVADAGVPGNGYRPSANHVLLYITGTTTFTGSSPYDFANSLRNQGLNMAAIQFEPAANVSYLAEIVGGDECVFSALDASSRESAILWFQNMTCNAQFCNNKSTSTTTVATTTTTTTTTTTPLTTTTTTTPLTTTTTTTPLTTTTTTTPLTTTTTTTPLTTTTTTTPLTTTTTTTPLTTTTTTTPLTTTTTTTPLTTTTTTTPLTTTTTTTPLTTTTTTTPLTTTTTTTPLTTTTTTTPLTTTTTTTPLTTTTTTTTATSTVKPETTTTPILCNLQLLTYDVVILLDASDYMGEANFNASKEAIIDFASQYDWTNTRFALVGCATAVNQYNTFVTALDFDDFKTGVQLAQFTAGSPFADYTKGIEAADKLFTTANGHRPNAHPMVVYVVGSQINSSVVAPAASAAQTLRHSKAVFMAGMTISPTGSANTDLAQITGGPTCTTSAADASQLNASFVWIEAKTCSMQFCDMSPGGR